MARITLVTGGSRSGKSDFAQKYAEQLPGPHCFIATCRPADDEMSERIEKHRAARKASIWATCEEGIHIADAITRNHACSTFLIDCLTLWVNNILMHNDGLGAVCKEEDIAEQVKILFESLETVEGNVIFVTNEVGMGIVPQNELARRYRDLVGCCNRLVANGAHEVVLVSCGLPLYLKKIEKLS